MTITAPLPSFIHWQTEITDIRFPILCPVQSDGAFICYPQSKNYGPPILEGRKNLSLTVLQRRWHGLHQQLP